jgi:cullin-associated NEDD8-dissociated protein 1
VIVSESTISEGETSKQLSETFVQYVPRIWEVLAKHCDCSEEGVRNIVAECLGKLCIVDPDRFLSELLVLVRFL